MPQWLSGAWNSLPSWGRAAVAIIIAVATAVELLTGGTIELGALME